MSDIVQSLNFFLAAGTLLLQLATVALIVSYVAKREFAGATWLVQNAIPVAFFLTLVASALTLFYSGVLGFVPCGLCWFQRIFLYPQVVILGIALWKKRRDVAEYIIGLSLFGGVFALYQHYLQMGGSEFVACPTTGAGADCAKRILFEFGYITFPLMSFSIFVFLIVLMLLLQRKSIATCSVS